jgi:seryl-tRNA synthetase
MLTENKILELKEEIDEAKNKVAELKGQQNAILRQIKEEFACKSIKDAKLKAEDIQNQLTKIDKQIEEASNELEEKYDFD